MSKGKKRKRIASVRHTLGIKVMKNFNDMIISMK